MPELTNKDIRKKRTLAYFIEAAQKIIAEEGEGKLTIRKVASLAGYNSATLYNYFDDLDHLILYASLKYLNLYNIDVAKRTRDDMSARERLAAMWESFCRMSFEYPGAFAHIFFDKHSKDLQSICRQYYELFPEELNWPIAKLSSVESYLSLPERNRITLQNFCTEEGLPFSNVEIVNELMLLTYKGLLYERIGQGMNAGCNTYFVEKMLSYVDHLLATL